MEGSGRPKESDYDEVTKEIILTATGIYHCLVSMSNAFPTPLEEVQLIKLAWDRENVETAQEVPIAISLGIAKVVSWPFIFTCMCSTHSLYLFRYLHMGIRSGAKSKSALQTMWRPCMILKVDMTNPSSKETDS